MGRANVISHWVIIGIGLVAFPSLWLGGADPDWWTVGFAAVWTLNAAQLWSHYETLWLARWLARLLDANHEHQVDR